MCQETVCHWHLLEPPPQKTQAARGCRFRGAGTLGRGSLLLQNPRRILGKTRAPNVVLSNYPKGSPPLSFQEGFGRQHPVHFHCWKGTEPLPPKKHTQNKKQTTNTRLFLWSSLKRPPPAKLRHRPPQSLPSAPPPLRSLGSAPHRALQRSRGRRFREAAQGLRAPR